MKHFSFYHKESGVFATSWYSASEPLLQLNTPADHVAIEGRYHPLAHRFDVAAGVIVRPDSPGDDHEWHEAEGRWAPNAVALAKLAAEGAYRQRSAELADEERRLHRRVARAPGDIQALARLAAIDDELDRLRGPSSV